VRFCASGVGEQGCSPFADKTAIHPNNSHNAFLTAKRTLHVFRGPSVKLSATQLLIDKRRCPTKAAGDLAEPIEYAHFEV
jgi:hypothetical protein